MIGFEVLTIHLFSDFMFSQCHWMRVRRQTLSSVCALHSVLYSLPLLAMAPVWGIPVWVVALIAIQHFLQDRYVKMDKVLIRMGKGEYVQPPYSPWSVILFDQILHMLWIVLVFRLIP